MAMKACSQYVRLVAAGMLLLLAVVVVVRFRRLAEVSNARRDSAVVVAVPVVSDDFLRIVHRSVASAF